MVKIVLHMWKIYVIGVPTICICLVKKKKVYFLQTVKIKTVKHLTFVSLANINLFLKSLHEKGAKFSITDSVYVQSCDMFCLSPSLSLFPHYLLSPLFLPAFFYFIFPSFLSFLFDFLNMPSPPTFSPCPFSMSLLFFCKHERFSFSSHVSER